MAHETFIAFDLATKRCGVAIGNPFSKKPPEFLSLEAISVEIADRGIFIGGEIRRLLTERLPSAVFIEKPMKAHVAAKIGTTEQTSLQLNGLVFVAMIEARAHRIPYFLIERQKALAHFTGAPRYKAADDAKRACLNRARQLGWNPLNFDEADAAALLDFGAAQMQSKAFIAAALERPPMWRPAVI